MTKPITQILEKLNIKEKDYELYGKTKAKINNKIIKEYENKPNGKLILVTAINPTPLGEGKTTIAIGVADGLNKIGKKAILALREPSMGPVFGIKGGATGGGKSRIIPEDEINLHFTGDMHAITSANNLLSSIIDNHIFHGNKLKIKKVTWTRCLDLNDRQLRKVQTGLSGEKNTKQREDEFKITVASEIMAILCLSKDIDDLKNRLSNIIIGYNEDDKPIFVKDLNAQGAMTVILKNAINPNLVQTLEDTPVLVHGGPFANIAHGCNSIIATKLGLKLADYTITEAGFGSDLGAEKFLDIKCRKANIKPDAVVCVATIKALKFHGGIDKEDILKENIEGLKNGSHNLLKHIDNLINIFKTNAIVAINKNNTDTDEEIETLINILEKNNIEYSIVENFQKGGEGAVDIANKLVDICDKKSKLEFIYDLEDSIKDKIEKVAKSIYGASGVEYTDQANENIKEIEKLGYDKLPICIAKTPLSFSDDPKNLICDKPFKITIRKVEINAGAEFIVVLTSKVLTMPGLPEVPNAETFDLDEDGNIVGNF